MNEMTWNGCLDCLHGWLNENVPEGAGLGHITSILQNISREWYRTFQEPITEHIRSLLQGKKELITKAYCRAYKEHVTYHIRRTLQSISAACIVQNISGEFYRAYQEHVTKPNLELITEHILSLLQIISGAYYRVYQGRTVLQYWLFWSNSSKFYCEINYFDQRSNQASINLLLYSPKFVCLRPEKEKLLP